MASTKSFSTGSKALVLIDGTCVLCNRVAKFVIRHDPAGRFRFATLDSARASAELTLRGLPPPPLGTFVLVMEGQAYFRSEAALRLLGMLPFPWSWAYALRIIPAAVRDPAYALVSRLRYQVFGRVATCALLTPDERQRFLAPPNGRDSHVGDSH